MKVWMISVANCSISLIRKESAKADSQIEEKVHFGQFSSIFFLYVENKKLSETPKYQCF